MQTTSPTVFVRTASLTSLGISTSSITQVLGRFLMVLMRALSAPAV